MNVLVDLFPAIRVITDESLHAYYGNRREPVRATGVRPEYLLLDGASESANALVELVEPLGQDTYVHLRADDSLLVAVTKRTMLRIGDRVEIRVDEANVQVMDKETGRNVSAPLDGE